MSKLNMKMICSICCGLVIIGGVIVYRVNTLSVVDGIRISRADVNKNIFTTREDIVSSNKDLALEDVNQLYDNHKEFVLTTIEDRAIVLKKAMELGVFPLQSDLDADVDTKINIVLGLMGEQGEVLSRKEMETIKNDIANEIILYKLIEFVSADVTVSEEELVDFYEKNKESFAIVPTANLKAVSFATQYDAENCLLELLTGESFDVISDKYNGGFYGHVQYYTNNYMYSKDLLNATKDLMPGEYTGVVVDNEMYSIFQVIDKTTESRERSFAESYSQVKEICLINKKNEYFNTKMSEWRDVMVERKKI